VAVRPQGRSGREAADPDAKIRQQGNREAVPRQRGVQGAGGEDTGSPCSRRGEACNGRGGGAGGEPAGARGRPHHCGHFATRLVSCGQAEKR